MTSKTHITLTSEEERVGKLIVSAVYAVRKALGPGLLKKVYELCFCHELGKRGLHFQRKVDIPITYDGILFTKGLRLDVLVEDLVVCELNGRRDKAATISCADHDAAQTDWKTSWLSHQR